MTGPNVGAGLVPVWAAYGVWLYVAGQCVAINPDLLPLAAGFSALVGFAFAVLTAQDLAGWRQYKRRTR